MLDSHIVNIRNEVDNWLLSFNEAISDKNSKTDSIENLNKLFFENSHWRDILALTWQIACVEKVQSNKETGITSNWAVYLITCRTCLKHVACTVLQCNPSVSEKQNF